jgi:hypothetical protein
VIRAVAEEDPVAAGLAAAAVIRARQLEGEVVGLAAARGEGEDRVVQRHHGGKARRQLGDSLVGHPGVERRELEPPDLRRDPLRDLLPPVPDHPGAEVVAGVEQLPVLVVEEVGALPAGDHARVGPGIPLLERGEVRQEMANGAARGHACALNHRLPPSSSSPKHQHN